MSSHAEIDQLNHYLGRWMRRYRVQPRRETFDPGRFGRYIEQQRLEVVGLQRALGVAQVGQLYEQGADPCRIGEYVNVVEMVRTGSAW